MPGQDKITSYFFILGWGLLPYARGILLSFWNFSIYRNMFLFFIITFFFLCLIYYFVSSYSRYLHGPFDISQAAINEHQLNYSLPRACFVHQTDFDLVLDFDKNKLSLGKASFRECRVSFCVVYFPHPLHYCFFPFFPFYFCYSVFLFICVFWYK